VKLEKERAEKTKDKSSPNADFKGSKLQYLHRPKKRESK